MKSQVIEENTPITCMNKTTKFNNTSGFIERQKRYYRFITDDEIGDNIEVFHNNKVILEDV